MLGDLLLLALDRRRHRAEDLTVLAREGRLVRVLAAHANLAPKEIILLALDLLFRQQARNPDLEHLLRTQGWRPKGGGR